MIYVYSFTPARRLNQTGDTMTNTNRFAVQVASLVAKQLMEDARRARAMGRPTAVRRYVQQARYHLHRAIKFGAYGTTTDFIMGR